MKKYIFLTLLMLTLTVGFTSALHADNLDGLWRNDRDNITIRIEQDQDGFRAKRTDQGIWYNYVFDDGVYIDKRGNWYELINEDQIEWTDVVSRKRILFDRVESRNDNSWTNRDRDDRWNSDYDRNERVPVDQRRMLAEGRWYDKRSKERLIIEETNNGYRVRKQNSTWEKFTSDRNGQRLRSRSGDVIQVVDRNTLRWRSGDGRGERIFIRQGNGQVRSNDHERGNGHHNEKHNSSGKNQCG